MLSNPPYGKSWKSDLGAHGRQGRNARPALRDRARRRPANTPSSRAPATARCCSWRTCVSKMKHDTPARQPHRRGPQRLLAVHRRRRPGREQYPPLDHRERLAGGHRRAAAEHVLQHRHRDLHLGAHQPQAGAPPRQGATHRRHAVVQAAAQEPGQEELRAFRRRYQAHLRRPSSRSRRREQSKIFPTRPSATGR